jgi:hypothetical protein
MQKYQRVCLMAARQWSMMFEVENYGSRQFAMP